MELWYRKNPWKELERLHPPKFMFNGVAQCWQCANCCGESKQIIGGYPFRVPECKKLDVYVLEVYDKKCRAFQETPWDRRVEE